MLRDDNTTTESTAVKLKQSNRQLTESLIQDGGMLQVGCVPAVEAGTAEGEKQALELLTNSTTGKIKGKTKKEREEQAKTEEVAPKTIME